jgi:pilus assembly protein CpaE
MHRIALLGHDQFLIGRVRAAANELAGISVLPLLPSKFAPELAVLKPVVVLIDLSGSDTLAMLPQIIASVAASAGDVPVITIGDANDAAAVLAAVRAGSNDVIDREEPIANLRAHLERRLASADECKPGEVCGFSVVLNAQPGGGGGLFALNLAVLRATRAKEALFVDCQLPASEAGAALDIGISYSLADAARDISRMDRTLLLSAIAHHAPSGLSVLPLAVRAGDDLSISHEGLLAALRTIRPLFRNLVLNAGGLRDPGVLNVLTDWATSVHLICPQTVTALRHARDLLAALPSRFDAAERVQLVVDQFSPRIELSPEKMRAALNLDRVIALPDARDELINGLNIGRPYVLARPRAPYSQAIAAAAGGPEPVEAPRGRSLIDALRRKSA